MVRQLTWWSCSYQAMHRDSRSLSVSGPPRVGIPAKVPFDRNPPEATNKLEVFAVNDGQFPLSKQNPTAIQTGRLFEFNLEHHIQF